MVVTHYLSRSAALNWLQRRARYASCVTRSARSSAPAVRTRPARTGIRSVESNIKLSTLLKPDERYEVAAWVHGTRHDRSRSRHDRSRSPHARSRSRHDHQRSGMTASDTTELSRAGLMIELGRFA